MQGETGKRYHVKNRPKQGGGSAWRFEEVDCSLGSTDMLLVRMLVAKVENRDQVSNVLRNTPIRQGTNDWNCVHWMHEALKRLDADSMALGTRVTEWGSVRGIIKYCQKKEDEHRFDGKGNFDMSKVPTYDLLKQKETVP